MPKIELPIDLGFYQSSSTPLADQTCINLYPVNPQTKGASSKGALFSAPGIEQVHKTGESGNRGMLRFKNQLYIVNGNALYVLTANNNLSKIGNIAGTNRVIMAQNGETLAVQVPSGEGYFWDGSTFILMANTPVGGIVYQGYQAVSGGVTSVTYKDGFFVFTTQDEIFVSSLVTQNKGQDFAALDFLKSLTDFGKNVRTMTVNNELYVLSEKLIDLYQNVGASGFPFLIQRGATIQKGLASRWGVVEFDNSFAFIGNGQGEEVSIWRAQRGFATKISTSAIDEVIQGYTADEISEVFAWSYGEGGNFFLGFTFPDRTFVYDSTASFLQQIPVWHERSSNGGRWRVSDIVAIYGKRLTTDIDSNQIGHLDRDFTNEYGTDTIAKEFSGPYLANQNQALFISELELKTEPGLGNINFEGAVGVDPVINLSYSDDGGKSFSTEVSQKLGKNGEFLKRQIWRRLGRANTSRIFKFTVDEDVKVNLLAMYVNAEVQNNG